MHIKWTVLIVLLLSTGLFASAQSPALPTDICGDETVTPSEATILEEIKTIDTVNPYILHSASPTCTFVVAMFQVADNPGGQRQFVAWTLYGGNRLFDYVRPRETNREVPVIHWNSQESEVLIGAWYDSSSVGFDRATFPYHLWKLDGSSAVVMRCETSCVVPTFDTVTWDDGRNWVWTRGWSGVVAYDRTSGQVARSFYNPPWDGGLVEPATGHGYRFSDDGTHVIVATTSGTVDAITVWNIDKYIAYAVNASGFVNSAYALSPDNRYLAVGYRAIRVWDLQNLPSDYDSRLPIYRHEGPITNIISLSFVDNTTIETRSPNGIQRWDLHTGDLLETVVED